MFIIDYSYLLHSPTSARLCFSNYLDIGILKKKKIISMEVQDWESTIWLFFNNYSL